MRADQHARVLEHALSDIPFDGFTAAVLKRAADKEGVTEDEMKAAFPKGPVSLVEQISEWADGEMAQAMAGTNIKSVREKITRAVRARIEVLASHKAAARKAAAFLATPGHAVLGAKLIARTSDAIWRAIGDTSTDFNYYTKRATLAGVYGSTLVYWLSDSSEDSEATWAFLDTRIQNVMAFEKWKGQARNATQYVPDPFKILGALRGFRPR